MRNLSSSRYPLFKKVLWPDWSIASSVPRSSRSPLNSPLGAGAPDRCSPGRGTAFVANWPSLEKPGSAADWQVHPVPSAQPWQQYIWPSCVYPSPGHSLLIIVQPGQTGWIRDERFRFFSLNSIFII
jgi:hypothetical protein